MAGPLRSSVGNPTRLQVRSAFFLACLAESARGHPGPSPERATEVGRIGVAENVGNLFDTGIARGELIDGALVAARVDDSTECGAFFDQSAVQGEGSWCRSGQ